MATDNGEILSLSEETHGAESTWYKDAIIYELHVRAFHDSDSDGIGDFAGLTEKLDYLQDLGITAIWLLPFYPSPLKDDGYDISDYGTINPNYGTIRDFKAFIKEANWRGIRVITEMVLNHTSDQHPWFQRARREPPGSKWRDFYVWSDTIDRYKETRIIFKDFETSNWSWDAVAKAYYWHRFYSHQPDLNYDSTLVRQTVLRALNFWLGLGVSGLRLDAIPYLYEREGTNCENLPETHAFLKALRRHVDKRFPNTMLLSEANQWAEDAVAYFGEGDESHMAFHFPLMPRMFMAIRMEDRFPIVDIIQQTPSIPDSCQWALFLRNHDELTLEMVTDEERDYMYRVYAHDTQARINLGIRRRLAPLLNNDRRKIELMNGLLFSLPGTPIIYYGDEIGMGDNFYLGDRNGVRTPMQWSADRNAGFSRTNPQRLFLPVNIDPEYHYEAVNVDIQQNNPDSLLWWMKRLIAARKRFNAFSRGSLEFLYPENRKVLAFLRRYQDETVLIVANLSRLAQHTTLNLAEYAGKMPVEVFGQTEFPSIGEGPYSITLNPYAFYWFSLEPQRAEQVKVPSADIQLSTLTMAGEWKDLFNKEGKPILESTLLGYIRHQRWFGGKARYTRSCEIQDVIPLTYNGTTAHLLWLRVDYTEGETENYLLPIAFAHGEQAVQVLDGFPGAVISRLKLKSRGISYEGIIYDALIEKEFNQSLLQLISRRRHIKGKTGEIVGVPTRVFRRLRGPVSDLLEAKLLRGEQTNTSVIYGDRLMLKLFRRPEEGVSVELEVGRFLTEKVPFPNAPPVAGALEYQTRKRSKPVTLAILHGYVSNEGDAWKYTLDSLGHYYERVLTYQNVEPPMPSGNNLLDASMENPPDIIEGTMSPYLDLARLLGQRTAELHLSLASAVEDQSFTPEPFSLAYQRSLYHTMRGFTIQIFQLLRQQLRKLPDEIKPDVKKVIGLENHIIEHFQSLLRRKMGGMRIRCHGDYHLGQVLYTGNDLVIIDFEGEPARPLSERRIKRSPLKDVAGMIRSFHYAAYVALHGQASTLLRTEDIPVLEQWAHVWYQWVSAGFLKSYLELVSAAPLLPNNREDLGLLLDAYLLEKGVYEINYELNNRPDWLWLPLKGIQQVLGIEE